MIILTRIVALFLPAALVFFVLLLVLRAERCI